MGYRRFELSRQKITYLKFNTDSQVICSKFAIKETRRASVDGTLKPLLMITTRST